VKGKGDVAASLAASKSPSKSSRFEGIKTAGDSKQQGKVVTVV
jgi:hypothetical protein